METSTKSIAPVLERPLVFRAGDFDFPPTEIHARPRIAGYSTTYIVHQLAGFHVGARNSEMDELMKGEVANLTQDDIVSLAAYVSSLSPEK